MSLNKSELYNFINASNLTGESTYDIWKYLNPDGTEQEFIESIRGKCALEYWLEREVNAGKTEEDFYTWLETDNSQLIVDEIAAREAAVVQALADAKGYTNEKLAEEIAAREAADTQNLDAAKTYADELIQVETTAREVADIQTLTDANSYTDDKLAEEIAAREAADTQNLNAAKTYTDEQVTTAKEELKSTIQEVKNTSDSAVPNTTTINGKQLNGNINLTAEDVGADVAGSADNALAQAKTYTDNAVADLVGTAPEKLDTIHELADAMQANDEVISAVNEAIGKKQNTITGAATTIVDDDLETGKVLVSDANGKVSASGVTNTELSHLSGVTSNIQEQINTEVSNLESADATNLQAAKDYADNKDNEVKGLIDTLSENINTKVSFNNEQVLTDDQKNIARTNIGLENTADVKFNSTFINFLVMKDAITGCEYFVTIENGVIVYNAKLDSLEITKMPDKMIFYNDETLEGTGIEITAHYQDGTSEVITDYVYEMVIGSDSIDISYTRNGVTCTVKLEGVIIKSVAEFTDTLIDFVYTDNGDGTFTLTDWKGTYNGVASNRIIIPNSERIKL